MNLRTPDGRLTPYGDGSSSFSSNANAIGVAEQHYRTAAFRQR